MTSTFPHIPIDSSANTTHGACVGCRNDSPFELAFEFAYQPIVDFSSRTIFGHETLVR
jgi:EAL domain-containing protein (putative c-di-GMP-specific phosphodiesterase class I)